MLEEDDIYAKLNSMIIADLGRRFKRYRVLSQLTQRDVAEKAGVSIFTISQFEKGEDKNITFGNFLALLRSIGLLEEVEKLLPLMPDGEEQQRWKERVRHGK
ncbi:MAG: helix-turn-helix domain-containing protein [Prevotella sp.]|jgi:transcriptional regulator with XRE-family HTH domain|uniref:Helix-turn-helix domain-containing protein n=1 Tax=Segatella cerevisiae TaxID=2053716 RepID=A0ABT1BWX9_9BACT|nr:helix-turn-helix transcriptional regulator [Segatella cerevisiae]MCH3994667.1 helix-turn-helix domain-containing protein [Prevotella sp.]MCI1246502.1 helix-turn-helix domain-containing protein [Prevotella sp.]MCO6025576.1 helix-turn-helix domain-containing protein [Segatella cerevisiae]